MHMLSLPPLLPPSLLPSHSFSPLFSPEDQICENAVNGEDIKLGESYFLLEDRGDGLEDDHCRVFTCEVNDYNIIFLEKYPHPHSLLPLTFCLPFSLPLCAPPRHIYLSPSLHFCLSFSPLLNLPPPSSFLSLSHLLLSPFLSLSLPFSPSLSLSPPTDIAGFHYTASSK